MMLILHHQHKASKKYMMMYMLADYHYQVCGKYVVATLLRVICNYYAAKKSVAYAVPGCGRKPDVCAALKYATQTPRNTA